MTRRAGSADLPLHGGHVPKWLADRMNSARGGDEPSDCPSLWPGRASPAPLPPFLVPVVWSRHGHGLALLGYHHQRHWGAETRSDAARWRTWRPRLRWTGQAFPADPAELFSIGERVGFDGGALADASRLVAKVDSAAVQDGFDLYLHGFIVTDDGKWVVVQQGMNGDRKQARRYHWLSEGLNSFVDAPHAAIDGVQQGEIINLTDRRAEPSRRTQLEMLSSLGPDGIVRELSAFSAKDSRPERRADAGQLSLPHLVLPDHHEVRSSDVMLRRLHGNLSAATNRGPEDFSELLLTPGVGLGRSARWRWSLKSYTELRIASAILPGSPSRTAGKMGTLSRSRCGSMTRRSGPEICRPEGEAWTRGGTRRPPRLDEKARRLERHATGPTAPRADR